MRALGVSSAAPSNMYDSWLTVENARRALRLSRVRAMTEAVMMVNEARNTKAPSTPMVRMQSAPKTNRVTRTTAKTPVLTTATACSSALTGVGATIAAGSQPWSGIRAHFASPKRKSRKSTDSSPGWAVWTASGNMPPAENSRVPVRL